MKQRLLEANALLVLRLQPLVGISSQFFRCMECGGDLEQHVNGKISYIPIMPSTYRWRLSRTLRIGSSEAKAKGAEFFAPRDKPKKRPGKHKTIKIKI